MTLLLHRQMQLGATYTTNKETMQKKFQESVMLQQHTNAQKLNVTTCTCREHTHVPLGASFAEPQRLFENGIRDAYSTAAIIDCL